MPGPVSDLDVAVVTSLPVPPVDGLEPAFYRRAMANQRLSRFLAIDLPETCFEKLFEPDLSFAFGSANENFCFGGSCSYTR